MLWLKTIVGKARTHLFRAHTFFFPSVRDACIVLLELHLLIAVFLQCNVDTSHVLPRFVYECVLLRSTFELLTVFYCSSRSTVWFARPEQWICRWGGRFVWSCIFRGRSESQTYDLPASRCVLVFPQGGACTAFTPSPLNVEKKRNNASKWKKIMWVK